MLSLYNSANINRHRSIFFGLAFILALASISILSPVPVQAAQVTIGWNASSSTVSGYKVYYGLSSGNYTYPVRDAGNSLSYTIPDDITAPTCYITATSYDATQESAKAAELVIYSMTASAGTGGSISSSGTTYATAGSGVTYTITPSSGYKVAGVTVDGASAGAVTSYTFSNVAAAHTISATFSAVTTTYTITASAGANGSISPSGTSTVNAGASQTYTITPSTGYKVAGVTVDGTSVGAGNHLYLLRRCGQSHHRGHLRRQHLYDHGKRGRQRLHFPDRYRYRQFRGEPGLHHHPEHRIQGGGRDRGRHFGRRGNHLYLLQRYGQSHHRGHLCRQHLYDHGKRGAPTAPFPRPVPLPSIPGRARPTPSPRAPDTR